MTGIFRSNNPLNTFLLFIYGFLLKFGWLLHSQAPVVHKSDGFLFNSLVTWLNPYFHSYPKSWFIIVYLLIFTQAISLNQVIISRRMMLKPNYLPAMSYLLITSCFQDWNVLSAPLIINTILVWMWARLSNLNLNQHAKSTLFNVGLGIGIAAFFYWPVVIFVLLVILTLVITRPVKIAEWIVTIVGVIIPWYFLASWLFLNDSIYSFRFFGMGRESFYQFHYNPYQFIALAYIILLILSGLFFMRTYMYKQLLQVRKNWVVMLLYFLVAAGIPFVLMNLHICYWLLALLPAAAFIGCTFYYPRYKWIPNILQYLFIAFALYMQYFAGL